MPLINYPLLDDTNEIEEPTELETGELEYGNNQETNTDIESNTEESEAQKDDRLESDDTEQTDELEETETLENDTKETEEKENNDNTDEYEEVELPEWIDDELIPPETFKTQKEENEWYKSNYEKLLTFYSKKDFVNNFIKTYEEKLIEVENKVDTYKAIADMLEGNPETVIKMYAPQYLATNGIAPDLSEQDVYNIIDYNLQKEFGKDYMEHFKPDQANIQGTLSNKMLQRQNALLEQIDEYKIQQQDIIKQYQRPTKEQLQQILEEEYNRDFKNNDFTKEEFYEFYKEVQKKIPQLKLKDYHRALYFDDYMKHAYEKGKKDGQKSQIKKLNTAKEKVINNERFNNVSNINFEQKSFWLKRNLGK